MCSRGRDGRDLSRLWRDQGGIKAAPTVCCESQPIHVGRSFRAAEGRRFIAPVAVIPPLAGQGGINPPRRRHRRICGRYFARGATGGHKCAPYSGWRTPLPIDSRGAPPRRIIAPSLFIASQAPTQDNPEGIQQPVARGKRSATPGAKQLPIKKIPKGFNNY